jgi:hypothetical protein
MTNYRKTVRVHATPDALDDAIEMCTRGWDHDLASLHAHVETGSGHPCGSEADLARRTA